MNQETIDQGLCWHKGKYFPLNEMCCPIIDLAILRGYGIFEAIRTYGKKPFHLDKHIDRFFQSMKTLNLPHEISKEEIHNTVFELSEKSPFFEERLIKIVLTGGISYDFLLPNGSSNLFIFSIPIRPNPREWYEEGIVATSNQYTRFLPNCKTLMYFPGVYFLQKAKESHNAKEVLLRNLKDEITEGVTSNFFGFQKDKLITIDSEILFGVTREIILEVAKRDFSIEKRAIRYDELSYCDEVFICSTTKEVIPIIQIDEIQIGDGTPGPRTKRLLQLFREYSLQFAST